MKSISNIQRNIKEMILTLQGEKKGGCIGNQNMKFSLKQHYTSRIPEAQKLF